MAIKYDFYNLIRKSCAIIPVWKNPEIIEVLRGFHKPFVNEVVVVLDEPNEVFIKKILDSQKFMSCKLTVLINKKRQGIGYAIRKGLLFCLRKGYRVAVIMAGNGKDDPREIPKLILKILDGYDYVQGSRFLKGGRFDGTPFHRLLFNLFWAFFWSILLRKKITEVTNGFRAYKLSILKDPNIKLNQAWLNGYAFEYYLHYKVLTLGYRYTEVPVSKIYKKKLNYSKINPFKNWWEIILPPLLLKLNDAY